MSLRVLTTRSRPMFVPERTLALRLIHINAVQRLRKQVRS
jgi:hypothetical protein